MPDPHANDDDPSGSMSATLLKNIDRLQERAEADAKAASLSTRVADRITAFVGSMAFVILHVLLYGGWIGINLGWIPGIPRFDPSFVILAMEASVEAIFLSTFVLISQNRMAGIADRREKLDLHINLLAEHELTKLAGLVSRIADHLGIPETDRAFHEIKMDVEPEQVLDALEQKEPSSRS